MALPSEYQALAAAVQDCARALKSSNNISNQTIANNQAQALDWNSQEAIDALAGLAYDNTDVSNGLGSLADFINTWWATHGGNMEKMLTEHPIV